MMHTQGSGAVSLERQGKLYINIQPRTFCCQAVSIQLCPSCTGPLYSSWSTLQLVRLGSWCYILSPVLWSLGESLGLCHNALFVFTPPSNLFFFFLKQLPCSSPKHLHLFCIKVIIFLSPFCWYLSCNCYCSFSTTAFSDISYSQHIPTQLTPD